MKERMVRRERTFELMSGRAKNMKKTEKIGWMNEG